MNPASTRLRIGTSGYQYDHWRGVFYPKKLPKDNWFDYYTRYFDTVEINNTFYHLPQAKVFDGWCKAAPTDFFFSLKFSRYGTHLKKLLEPKASIRAFIERAKRLGNKLGPILVQLPPHWKANLERLEDFLEAAPATYLWAFEFRDPSWLNEEVFACLEESGAALCIHDLLERHPRRLTADWVYLRFHGAQYEGNYTNRVLNNYARWIEDLLADGLEVFAYFNNDIGGHAISNATYLRERFS